MSLFGTRDQYSDAPKGAVNDKANTGQDQFGNTVYGVDATETEVNGNITHSGWIQRIVGYGPLVSITINSGGTSYSNSDTISITSTTGVNAAANVVTDGSGTITDTTITEFGSGFDGTESITISTGTGSSANLEPVFGGRSGRVTYETLVAGGIDFDATDFANTSTANVANSTGTADDTLFPDS